MNMDKWNILRDQVTEGFVQAESQNKKTDEYVLSRILDAMTEIDKEVYRKDSQLNKEIISGNILESQSKTSDYTGGKIGDVLQTNNGLYVVREMENGNVTEMIKLKDYISKCAKVNIDGEWFSIDSIIEKHCSMYLSEHKLIKMDIIV